MVKKYFSIKYFKGQRLLLLAFLLLHTIASFYYISQHNITFDEPDYFEYAKRWLHGKPERIKPLDDSKTPIIAITWLPRTVRQVIDPGYQLNDYGRKDQREGRYMMILFSFLTALYVYKWCKLLYGPAGWQLPLLLLLFDPLYLSYSTLISTDLACGALLVAVLYHLNQYLLLHSHKHFWLTAFLTGIGIVTKQNLLLLMIILPVLFVIYRVSQNKLKQAFTFSSLGKVLGFSLVILLVINSFYYFYHSFKPLGEYTFESSTLRSLQSVSFLRQMPVPLPEPYVQSVDMLKAHSEIGGGTTASTYHGVYLFGTLKLTGGYWYYYLVMLFYKLPIGTMLLLLACVALLIRKFRYNAIIQQYMFLLVPAFFYWFVLSFFNQFQTGIRHLLLVFPLLFIGLGYLFKQVSNAGSFWKLLVVVMVLYSFVSVAVYYPHLIAYTNEFVTNKKTVYRKIFDSSIDYGQSDSSMSTFLQKNPGYKMKVATPAPGKYAVRMGEMLDLQQQNKSPYRWYMAHEPTGHYRYTILLFEINEADLKKADAAKTEYRIVNAK